jgi:hypothetical protein
MPVNPNDVYSAAFRKANGLPAYKIKLSSPKVAAPKPVTKPTTVFSTPAFKKANAPDQVTAKPKPKPAAPAPQGGNYYPTLPGVQAAVQNVNQILSGGSSPAAIAQAYSGMGNDANLLKQAREMVGYELDPQIHAAQAAYNQENRDYGWLINSLNRQTSNAKGDVTALFGGLDQLLAAGNQAQAQAYSQAGTKISSAYDQLASMLDSGYTNAQNAATAEQQRLGISGPGQNDRLNSDKAYLSGLAQEQKANAVGNITAQGANAQSIAGSMRASAQEAAPHLVASIVQQSNEQQQTLLKQHIDNLTKYKNQVGLLNEQRGGKVQMVLHQLQDQLYQRQQDAAQLQFMNSIRAGELGISAANLQLAQARLAQDGQIATDRAVLEAKKLKLSQAQQAAGPSTGMERAFDYLDKAYPNKGRQQDLQDALIDAINGNSTDPGYNPAAKSGEGGYGIPGYNTSYLDTYLAAIDSAVRDRANQGWGPIERSVLRNAALKFFNK